MKKIQIRVQRKLPWPSWEVVIELGTQQLAAQHPITEPSYNGVWSWALFNKILRFETIETAIGNLNHPLPHCIADSNRFWVAAQLTSELQKRWYHCRIRFVIILDKWWCFIVFPNPVWQLHLWRLRYLSCSWLLLCLPASTMTSSKLQARYRQTWWKWGNCL